MIRIFGATDKTFTSNGDVSFIPLRANVYKTEYEDYYLDLECDLKYIDYLQSGNIVVADLPQGSQAFRINNPLVDGKKFSAKCPHVFFDSQNYLIADSFVQEKNCNEALNWLNNATEPQSEFEVFSTVSTINSFRCVRKSLYEAFQTVLERWGGHMVRDNFSVSIRASIQHDNGVVVQYRKNMKEISVEECWDDVCTKILPVGKDGTLLNAVNPSASIYISSPTQYDIPFTKTVSFSQDIDSKDYPDETAYKTALVADLQTQATQYLANNCVPKINYTLRANLEKITDIGDVIEVKDERLGLDLMTTVLAFEYDCIQERYIEVEFGNFKRNLSNLMSNIQKMINQTITERENQ